MKTLVHNSIRRFLPLVVGLGLVVASLVATAPPADAEVRRVLADLISADTVIVNTRSR